METKKINLLEVRDVGQSISAGIKILFGNYKHVFRTTGLMVLPIYLMATTMYYLLGKDMASISVGASPNQVFDQLFGINFIITIISYYLATISLIWGAVYYIKLYHERGPGNFEMADLWGEVFKHGWKLLYAMLAVVILTGILAVVAAFISVITLVLIPVIYIGWVFIITFLLFYPVTMLMEEEGITSGIERTFKLLKGNWFKAVGILIVSYAMVMLTFFGPMLILGVLMPGNIFQLEPGASNVGVLLLIQNILQIFSLFFGIIIQFSFAVFYFSCLEKLDKVALRKRIEELGPLSA